MLLTPRIVRTHELTQEHLNPIDIGSASNVGLTGPSPVIAAPPEDLAPAPAPGALGPQPPPPGGIPQAPQPVAPVGTTSTPGLPPSQPVPVHQHAGPAAGARRGDSLSAAAAEPRGDAVQSDAAAGGRDGTGHAGGHGLEAAGTPPRPRHRRTPPGAAPPDCHQPSRRETPRRRVSLSRRPPVNSPRPRRLSSPRRALISAWRWPVHGADFGDGRVADVGDERVADLNPAVLRVRNVQDGTFMRQGGINAQFSHKAEPGSGRVDITITRAGDATGASGTGRWPRCCSTRSHRAARRFRSAAWRRGRTARACR